MCRNYGYGYIATFYCTHSKPSSNLLHILINLNVAQFCTIYFNDNNTVIKPFSAKHFCFSIEVTFFVTRLIIGSRSQFRDNYRLPRIERSAWRFWRKHHPHLFRIWAVFISRSIFLFKWFAGKERAVQLGGSDWRGVLDHQQVKTTDRVTQAKSSSGLWKHFQAIPNLLLASGSGAGCRHGHFTSECSMRRREMAFPQPFLPSFLFILYLFRCLGIVVFRRSRFSVHKISLIFK